MKRFSVFLLCLLPLTVFAAEGDSLWSNSYGGAQKEDCYSIRQTTDGGYILAGHTESFGAGGNDFWLVKVSTNGDSLWSRTFGGSGSDWCYSVQQTTDGGYILAGKSKSFSYGFDDFWLVKTNANGDSLWSRHFGGASNDECRSVIQTVDGGYALAGKTQSFGAGNYDFWLLKTDANGDSQWSNTFGGNLIDECYNLLQTSDSGYVLSGHTMSYGAGSFDFWLLKTDAAGDSLWSYTYGKNMVERGGYVSTTSDGGYIIAGYTNSIGSGLNDYFLVRTNADGDSLWSNTFGTNLNETSFSAQQTSDGGYMLVGQRDMGGSVWNFFLVKTNSIGDSLWSRTFGGSSNDEAKPGLQSSDGAYIMGGITKSYGVGNGDMWLVKVEGPPSSVIIGATDISDNYAKHFAPTLNYGISAGLYAGRINGNVTYHQYSHFDFLSSVPSGATINVAICSLSVWNPGAADSVANIAVYRITSDWVEGAENNNYEYGSSSWNNQGNAVGPAVGVGGTSWALADSAWASAGGDYNTPDDTVSIVVGWETWEVETIVQAQRNANENFGMLFKEIDETRHTGCIGVRSKDHPTASLRPRLYIEYTEAPCFAYNDISHQDNADGISPDTLQFICSVEFDSVRTPGYWRNGYMPFWNLGPGSVIDDCFHGRWSHGIYQSFGCSTSWVGAFLGWKYAEQPLVWAWKRPVYNDYEMMRAYFLLEIEEGIPDTTDIDSAFMHMQFGSVTVEDGDSVFVVPYRPYYSNDGIDSCYLCYGCMYPNIFSPSLGWCNYWKCNGYKIWGGRDEAGEGIVPVYLGWNRFPVPDFIDFSSSGVGDTFGVGLVMRFEDRETPTGENKVNIMTDPCPYIVYYFSEPKADGEGFINWGLRPHHLNYGLPVQARRMYGGGKGR